MVRASRKHHVTSVLGGNYSFYSCVPLLSSATGQLEPRTAFLISCPLHSSLSHLVQKEGERGCHALSLGGVRYPVDTLTLVVFLWGGFVEEDGTAE